MRSLFSKATSLRLSLSLNHFIAIFLLVVTSCGGGGGGDSEADPVGAFGVRREVIASNLSTVTGLAASPDGRIFISELAGTVRTWSSDAGISDPILTLAPSGGDGGEGILGIAADPEFPIKNFIYIYYSHPVFKDNQVLKYSFRNNSLEGGKLILRGIPIGGHNGGKLVFGRDRALYVTTGDSGDPARSQDLGSLAGKVLRLGSDGSALPDNPFGSSPVFAYGFRDIFGADLDPATGEIVITDNGPDCSDEINIVRGGGNYGWRPEQSCIDIDPQFIQPAARVATTVGITGAAFYQGAMFPELNGELLVGDFNTGSINRYRRSATNSSQFEFVGLLIGGTGEGVISVAVAPSGEIFIGTVTRLEHIVKG